MTNRYPDEFKIRAVQLAENYDIYAKDVVANLEVHPILLYRWHKEYRDGNTIQVLAGLLIGRCIRQNCRTHIKLYCRESKRAGLLL